MSFRHSLICLALFVAFWGLFMCNVTAPPAQEPQAFEAVGQGYLSDGQRVEVHGKLTYVLPSGSEPLLAFWDEWGSRESFEEIELALTFAEQVRRVFRYYSPRDLRTEKNYEVEQLLQARLNEALRQWGIRVTSLRLSYPRLPQLSEPQREIFPEETLPEEPIEIAI